MSTTIKCPPWCETKNDCDGEHRHKLGYATANRGLAVDNDRHATGYPRIEVHVAREEATGAGTHILLYCPLHDRGEDIEFAFSPSEALGLVSEIARAISMAAVEVEEAGVTPRFGGRDDLEYIVDMVQRFGGDA